MTVTVEDCFPVYERLWKRAEDDGLFVHYGGWPDESLAGYFHPRDDGKQNRKPMLALRRPYYREPSTTPTRESNAPPNLSQPNLRTELWTLAHEYGHSRSWAGRTGHDDYVLYRAAATIRDEADAREVEALPQDVSAREWNERRRNALHAALSDDQRSRIVREEELAWAIGREVLSELGFTDLDEYDRTAKHHLHNHRYRLGIEDAWPGDFDA